MNAITHSINLDEAPRIPEAGWTVVKHRQGGIVELERKGDDLFLNGKKIIFFQSEKQKRGYVIPGYDLRNLVLGQQIQNANVLDYLCEHPELIPDSWIKMGGNAVEKGIFFWGTEFGHAVNYICICGLSYKSGSWKKVWFFVRRDWFPYYVAAALEN